MTNDIETLITALYVKIDDELGGPRWRGRPPVLTDSELVCLAAAQALLGFTSEAHWLRYARKHLAGMFPYLPQQSGYNKRLRAACYTRTAAAGTGTCPPGAYGHNAASAPRR